MFDLVSEPDVFVAAKDRLTSAQQYLKEVRTTHVVARKAHSTAAAAHSSAARDISLHSERLERTEIDYRRRAAKLKALRGASPLKMYVGRVIFAQTRAQLLLDKADKLSARRNELIRIQGSALEVVEAAKAVLEQSAAHVVFVNDELTAAQTALRYFRVHPNRYRRLDGEPLDHHSDRVAYMNEKRRVAIELVGIPDEFVRRVIVKERESGDFDFYFGSTCTPGVKDHAHYILFVDPQKEPFRRPPGPVVS